MKNRIINGDCTEVLKTIATGSVDFALTDPPYFVRYKDRSGRTIRNDRHPGTVLGAFDEVYRVLKPDSLCISFYGWQAVDAFMQAWKSAGFTPVGHIVWHKSYASSARFFQYLPRAGIRSGQGPSFSSHRAAIRRATLDLLRQPQPSDREVRRHPQASDRGFYAARSGRPRSLRRLRQHPRRGVTLRPQLPRHRAGSELLRTHRAPSGRSLPLPESGGVKRPDLSYYAGLSF